MELLAFERYMYFKKKGGNHMQFNVLSIPAASAKQAASSFEAAAEKLGMPLKQVSGPNTVSACYCRSEQHAATAVCFVLSLLPVVSQAAIMLCS